MVDGPVKGRLRRIGAAALTVMAAVMAFAVLGGIGLANGVISVAQYQYGGANKVTICHKGKTIRVSAKAWPAHQRHGDKAGACTTASKANKGKHKGAGKKSSSPGTQTTTTTTTSTTTTESSGKKGGSDNKGKGNGQKKK